MASAPEGGVAVALAPDGAVTVGALRVPRPHGIERVLLEAVEVGGVAADSATILACSIGSSWQAEAGGSLANAPATTCGSGVRVARDAASATWRADVTPLAIGDGPFISVALTPAAGDAASAGFEVRLARTRLVLQFGAEATEPVTAEGPAGNDSTMPSTMGAEPTRQPDQTASATSFTRSRPLPPPATDASAVQTATGVVQPSYQRRLSPLVDDGRQASVGAMVAISLAVGAATVAVRKTPGRRRGWRSRTGGADE